MLDMIVFHYCSSLDIIFVGEFYGVISFNNHFKVCPGFTAELSLVLLARNSPMLPKMKASILLLEI